MKRIERSSALLRESYTSFLHPSGLRIFVYPKQLTTSYAVLAVQYGSLDDRFLLDGEECTLPDGIAHFLEHKLFESEDGTDAFSAFSALGADANAYTSYTRTAYLFSCTENFSGALRELISFVTHPSFRRESVEREASIIAEEIRMYRDQPWERVYENMLRALYRRHPVRKNICGSVSSVGRITPEDLYTAYRAFYRPENMVLAVCGDVDSDEVLSIVEETLPTYGEAQSLSRVSTSDTGQVARAYIEEKMQVAKPLFCIGMKDAVLPKDPEERLRRELCMALLGELLFSQSGELYNSLFEKGLLTPAFTFGYSVGEGFAFECLSGESDDPAAVLREVKAYLKWVGDTGLDRAALERCRRALYADEVRAYDSTEEIANRLLSFAFEGTEMLSVAELLLQIGADELENLMRSFFLEDRFTLSVIRPLSGDDDEKGNNE